MIVALLNFISYHIEHHIIHHTIPHTIHHTIHLIIHDYSILHHHHIILYISEIMTEKFNYKRPENSYVLQWENNVSKQVLTTKGLSYAGIDKLGTI